MRTLRTEILTWKPDVDHRVHELEHAVLDLGERIDQVLETLTPQAPLLDPSASEQQEAVTVSSPPLTAAIRENHFASPSFKMPSSAHLELHPPRAASGSLDHGKSGFGAAYTVAPAQNPIKGATNSPNMLLHHFNSDNIAHCDRILYSPVHPPIPNLEFPTFDGTNPRLWIKYCETFFDVYNTDPSVWVKCATMRLVGSAALWYQTMQSDIIKMSWDTFVTTLCNRFDKDEHNHLIRHFFHIKQSSTVTEYVELFSDLVHQILAHDPAFPQTVITNRFLDGLKKEIRAVIMIHRPQTLDTASSLALLQEEAMQDQVTRRPELGSSSKKTFSEVGRSSVQSITHPTRLTEEKKTNDSAKSKTSDEKLSSLKQFRRAKGLCFKCGEKWSP
jgi:hypothetical protein